MNNLKVIRADCREGLRELAEKSVQCCVTSPPYWGLRSYLPKGHPDKAREIGQEKTPAEYVAALLAAANEVWRVLKDDGTFWLNLGDSYASTPKNRTVAQATRSSSIAGSTRNQCQILEQQNKIVGGLKLKDLVGIPWRVAFALQDAGWYLRSDIIWAKPNCMPESVTDRPARSHEYIFLLTKSPRYYYDHEAIKDAPSPALVKQVEEGYNGHAIKDYLGSNVQDASATKSRIISNCRKRIDKQRGHSRRHSGFNDKWDALTPQEQAVLGRNKRDVWTVAPACYAEAHFATFPKELIRPCILAGSRAGDIVLDPFGGSGTTGELALELGRKAILCELNDGYIPLIQQRTAITPGLALT